MPPVLALDGPSGSGKGTIGQLVAHEFGWHYLDSGAIYRSLAWVASEQKVKPDDIDSLVALADELELVFHVRLDDVADIQVNGQIVTQHYVPKKREKWRRRSHQLNRLERHFCSFNAAAEECLDWLQMAVIWALSCFQKHLIKCF